MYNFLIISLTAPKETLINRIRNRVKKRKLDASFAKTEINIMKRQLTWFKKYKPQHTFDIGSDNWLTEAKRIVYEWYNN